MKMNLSTAKALLGIVATTLMGCGAASEEIDEDVVEDEEVETSTEALLPNQPAAPSGLTLTVFAANPTVSLVWKDNSNNETGFQVQRARAYSGPWDLVTTTQAGVKAFTDSSASARTKYWYRIVAVNAAVSPAVLSKPSATKYGTTGQAICVPGNTQPCYSGPPGTQGVGACSAGVRICNTVGSDWSACTAEVTPTTEQCGTNVDEDCDGQVDEGCVVCGGADLQNDPRNCGTCNHVCQYEPTCQNGVCAPDAPPCSWSPMACGQDPIYTAFEGQTHLCAPCPSGRTCSAPVYGVCL